MRWWVWLYIKQVLFRAYRVAQCLFFVAYATLRGKRIFILYITVPQSARRHKATLSADKSIYRLDLFACSSSSHKSFILNALREPFFHRELPLHRGARYAEFC